MKKLILLSTVLFASNVLAGSPVRIVYNDGDKRHSTEHRQDGGKIVELFLNNESACFKDKAESLGKLSVPKGFTCTQGKLTWVYSIQQKSKGEFAEAVSIVCNDQNPSTNDIVLSEVSAQKVEAIRNRKNPKCSMSFVIDEFENEREELVRLKKAEDEKHSAELRKKNEQEKKRKEVEDQVKAFTDAEAK